MCDKVSQVMSHILYMYITGLFVVPFFFLSLVFMCNSCATRRSVEHNTPHANGAPLHFTGLSCIYFRMMFYLLPMLAKCGRGSISVQSPVTYQVETDQRKRSFESVMPDCYLYSS